MNKYQFEKDVTVYVNDNNYIVYVKAAIVRDEFDYDRKYIEFNKIIPSTEEGNLLDKNHEDFDDIINQVMDLDYDEDYEPEGLDGYFDCGE